MKVVSPIHILNASSLKKGVVYTCFTSGYDQLIQHNCFNENYDYICFTDDKELIQQKNVGIWQIKPMNFLYLDNPRNIRWYKIMPHKIFPQYNLSIWVDANINILTPKIFTITENIDKGMLFPKHFSRTCIYEECQRVLRSKKDDYDILFKVMEFLIEHNMPHNYGMNEANILIRRHHEKKVKKIMEEWWYMVKNYSKRDQLSLSYVLWKNGIKPDEISFPNARIDSQNFFFRTHAFDIQKEDK